MSGGGGGNFFKPKNLMSTVIGGSILGLGGSLGVGKLMKMATPAAPPNPGTPPVIGAPPTATDANPEMTAQQKSRKLRALQFGFASTIAGNPGFGSASKMPGLKTTLGQ